MRSIALEGLNDEQVERVQRYVDLLRRVGPREAAAARIHQFLDERRQESSEFSEDEAMELALDGQAWARQQKQ